MLDYLMAFWGALPGISFWHAFGVGGAALGQSLFVALYLTFPWWRNFLGQALFFKAVVFALLVDIAVGAVFFDWPHEDVTLVVLYNLVAFGIWIQFFAFLRIRLDGRQHRVSGNDESAEYREAHASYDAQEATDKAAGRR